MSFRFGLAVCLAAVGLWGPATGLADDNAPKRAYLDADEAGIDYRLQGEYAGSYTSDDQEAKFGVQVIALGQGKFQAVGYGGGLPGAGWDGEEPTRVDATRDDDKVEFKGDRGVAKLAADGSLTVYTADGSEQIGQARKVERKSPTLGMEPPEGALVLFDENKAEESLKNWRNGQLHEGKYLKATNPSSIETFGDHTLHMEFLLPFMPNARGQGRANSGLYIQHRYECQILDSFGLEGKNNECGGFYQIAAPSVNMCLPPLAWQTYDVEFTAARYDDQGNKTSNARTTVKHNGVVIHDDLELPRATAGGRPETAEPGPVFLQNHGDPVIFRNIWALKR